MFARGMSTSFFCNAIVLGAALAFVGGLAFTPLASATATLTSDSLESGVDITLKPTSGFSLVPITVAQQTLKEKPVPQGKAKGKFKSGSSAEQTLYLGWNQNPDASVIGYRVFFGRTLDPMGMIMVRDIVDPLTTSATFLSYTDLQLVDGDQACFRIKAYNTDGESPFSDGVCATLTTAVALAAN